MQLIDSHCHLDIPRFSSPVEQLVAEARKEGVKRFILPGVTASGWPGLLALCSHHQGLFGAPGLHPMYLRHHRKEDLQLLTRVAEHEKSIAIGEIGLDFYSNHTDASTASSQQQLFEEQLRIATKLKLPVILHVRKAHDKVLSTLRRFKFKHGGTVHAFGGSYQQATQYFDLGFCIGVAGTITYDRASKIRQSVSELPSNALVLETDSPDLPLWGQQGKPNVPKNLSLIAKCLADLRAVDIDTIARETSNNCIRTLQLPAF